MQGWNINVSVRTPKKMAALCNY